MRRKKIINLYEFRLMTKIKGAHLKRPQLHFGYGLDKPSDYWRLSDSTVIEIRNWLSRYINEHINPKPEGEIIRASRVHANQITKNMNKLEAEL